MSDTNPPKFKKGLIPLIFIIVVGLIIYYASSIEAILLVLVLCLFIVGFAMGAIVQLKAIRRMSDSPKSTIRGASQGNVELSGLINVPSDSKYLDLHAAEHKGYWKFSIRKAIAKNGQYELVTSYTSHDGHLALNDQETICWVDLSHVDYYTKKSKVTFRPSKLTQLIKKHAILKYFMVDLADAYTIQLEEEWLPSDEKVYAIGHFSSSPSSQVPDDLKTQQEISLWDKIARLTENTPEGEALKGTVTVNTLTMNRFGSSSTPVILSAFTENKIKRTLWFKFWLIVFCLLLLLSMPVLYFLERGGAI